MDQRMKVHRLVEYLHGHLAMRSTSFLCDVQSVASIFLGAPDGGPEGIRPRDFDCSNMSGPS